MRVIISHIERHSRVRQHPSTPINYGFFHPQIIKTTINCIFFKESTIVIKCVEEHILCYGKPPSIIYCIGGRLDNRIKAIFGYVPSW